MKKTAAILALGATLGGAGMKLVAPGLTTGTVFVRFSQQLPDGGTRDLGRTGCYELGGDVRASIEPCTRSW